MKLSIENNLVVARAENQADGIVLLGLATNEKRAPSNLLGDVPKKRKKTYVRKIDCAVCGKTLKGRQGLGPHMFRTHPGIIINGVGGVAQAHEYSLSTLPKELKYSIIKEFKSGDRTIRELAEKYGVSYHTVWQTIRDTSKDEVQVLAGV